MQTLQDVPMQSLGRVDALATDLMHQSALVALDIASARSTQSKLNRLQAIINLAVDIRNMLAQENEADELDAGQYWERFYAAKKRVCESCVFFRSGYVAGQVESK